jgi:ABC-2 type transport system ATP-binding protein
VRDLIAALRAGGATVFFSSHIIADIEVLCDRVAILNRGRLSHVGRLDELRQHEDVTGRLEITVLGASVAVLEDALRKVEGARVTASPGGARIDVASEQHVDAALAAARGCGARLVSVQPVRQSLEDLFVVEGTRALHAD